MFSHTTRGSPPRWSSPPPPGPRRRHSPRPRPPGRGRTLPERAPTPSSPRSSTGPTCSAARTACAGAGRLLRRPVRRVVGPPPGRHRLVLPPEPDTDPARLQCARGRREHRLGQPLGPDHGGPVDALPRAPPQPAERLVHPARRRRGVLVGRPALHRPGLHRLIPRFAARTGAGPYRGRMPRTSTLRLAALVAGLGAVTALVAGGFEARSSHLNQRRRSSHLNQRRPPGGSDDVPDERGEDLPLGRRAVVRQLHLAGEGDVVGQPARPGARPARHAHDQRDRDQRHGVGDADRARPALRPVGGAGPRRAVQPGGTPYHVVWELVPTSGYRCGARSIVLADYALGTSTREHVPPQRPEPEFTDGKTACTLGAGPVPHLRRRGHARPHLVVRRHPRA